MIGGRRSRRGPIDIWPGYVDALSTLLLLFVFVLTVFMLGQTVLSDALTGRDQALAELEDRLVELSDLLAIEQGERRALERELEAADARQEQLVVERDSLRMQLSDALGDAERLRMELTRAGEDLDTAEAERERLALQLASLRQDVAALNALRERLENEVAALAGVVEIRDRLADELQSELGAARDRRLVLEAELADAEERTRLAQREIDDSERALAVVAEQVGTLESRLDVVTAQRDDAETLLEQRDQSLREARSLSMGAREQVERLTRQIEALRTQLARVETALRLREEEIGERDVEIASLTERLNLALLQEVEDLSRYRSDFFGRLNALLGERDDIEVVGDRFRFQSELFFASGSAEVGPEGRDQLQQVAESLLAIASQIPTDLPWVLQVEGHTDRRPIQTAEFPSNWQLSTARAQAIVDFLIAQGVPAERLSPAGYAEHHPIDDRDTPEALRANRRIELRLTSR